MSARRTSVFDDLQALPSAVRVVTIGNFDGVHRGHQHLIRCVTENAKARGVRSLIVTFEPHPSSVLRPDSPFKLLTAPQEKLRLLKAAGPDEVAVLPFTREFASQEPGQFLSALSHYASPAAVYVGEGFRFGRNRSGDGATIEAFGASYGFDTTIITRLRDEETVISSSSIRNALANGDVATANAWLGRRYRLRGLVEHGAARGRELGFRTANLQLSDSACLPADGIYAAYSHVDDRGARSRQAIVYIGTRPTFAGDDRVLEAYILDFSGDLYARELEVEFVEFIRADARFESAEALAAQMARDEAATRAALSTHQADPSSA